MDDKNSKGHDHAEVEGERIYHHYLEDQVKAIRKTPSITKHQKIVEKQRVGDG